MDFKLRFQQKDGRDPRSRPNHYEQNGMHSNQAAPENRPTGLALNRFRKKTVAGSAPAGQFKKYMMEANNVFYENRPELKQLENIRSYKWGLIGLWAFLAITYFLIGRLSAYEGVCPLNARCGVFIRCTEMFDYDSESNTCELSS